MMLHRYDTFNMSQKVCHQVNQIVGIDAQASTVFHPRQLVRIPIFARSSGCYELEKPGVYEVISYHYNIICADDVYETLNKAIYAYYWFDGCELKEIDVHHLTESITRILASIPLNYIIQDARTQTFCCAGLNP